MEQDQKKLQTLSETLQQNQEDLQTSISTRQTLVSQQSESLAVQKELKTSSSSVEKDGQSRRVYRLLGPVLLTQPLAEAESTVSSRLTYIGKQIADTDGKIKDLQSTGEKTRGEFMGLQQKMQQQQQQQLQQQQEQVAG